MPRILAAVAVASCGLTAAEQWTLGPEKRLPAFRTASPAPGTQVISWAFTDGLDGWTPRSKTVRLSHDPETGHGAPGCLRVRGYDEGAWYFVWSPSLDVKPGAAYRVSMWLRVESVPEHAPGTYYFKVQMFEPEGKGGGALIGSSRTPVAVSGEWRQMELRFAVPEAGLDHVAFALEKGTQKRVGVDVCIDDVCVEEIPPGWADKQWRDASLTGPITGELRGVHPRLYLTAERIAFLRRAIRTDERWQALFETLRQQADTAVRHPPPDYAEQMKRYREGEPAGSHEQLWQRGVGNRIPSIALAYLLTDDPRYLEAAKTWLFAALDYPTWGIGRMAGLDLAAGHILAGVGLAYDWLYTHLTPDERSLIRQKVTPRAEKLARNGFNDVPFWHKAYMQNHLWVSLAGMCTTALALADEVPETASWICFAHGKFVRTLELLGDDGGSHEGYGYWEYGAEYIMRYLEMAKACLGIDLYVDSQGVPHPWLSRNAAYALHLALPRAMWTRKQSVVDLADCPRNHWYGPSYLLRNLARRYPDSAWQGAAQWLAQEFTSSAADATGSGHYLNFAWYDPTIAPRTPQAASLPLCHHFEDLGIVSSRSAWEGKATHLVVKCGPPLGHRHADGTADYGAGHVHPDVGHFILAARGEVLFRDSGYTNPKLTGNHSVVLVDGRGQKGEGSTWFEYGAWARDRRVPSIRAVASTPGGDVIDCDVAPAYAPDIGLRTFDRTFEFNRAERLGIRDHLQLERDAELEWRLQVEGNLEKLSETEWLTTVGEASASIRLSADVPVVVTAGILETNQHIRTETRSFLSVRTAGNVTSARLEALITVR